MKKTKNIPANTLLTTAFLLAFLSSCFQEDQMVPPHEQGDLEEGEIILGETYATQAFYNLATNSTISENIVSAWDLAFECNDSAWHVVLNAAQVMYAGNSKDTVFGNVTSSKDLEMLFDNSNGDLDSTAIGEWYYYDNDTANSHHYVYVIDRGVDENFDENGTNKITLDIANNTYILKYADLNGDNEKTIHIEKNDAYNYVYFSFNDDAVVDIAPPKEAWSLKFSKYQTMLKDGDDDYPYLVTGVLLNTKNVTVALDSTDFLAINIQDTSNYEFTTKMDFIGYDWKYYSFDNGNYTLVDKHNFIIKNYDGFFYKMRFIDFYDEAGIKGTITLEMVKL